MIRSTQGIIHGKIIELAHDLGVADGQRVEVEIRIVGENRQWGEGLRRCAGALADDPSGEDERILGEIYRARKLDVRKDAGQ